MYGQCTHGLGLSPSPTPRNTCAQVLIQILYANCYVIRQRIMPWAQWFGRHLFKVLGCVGEVRGLNPADLHEILPNEPNNQLANSRWGTRGAHALGHVSPYPFAIKTDTCHHIPFVHLSTNENAANEQPTVLCHVIAEPRRMLTSACATCHPSSGDTCHFPILVKPRTLKVSIYA